MFTDNHGFECMVSGLRDVTQGQTDISWGRKVHVMTIKSKALTQSY